MKYCFIQNIITPYRVSLFNSLQEHGFDFEVFYMSEKEDDRSWVIDYSSMNYSYKVFPGFYKSIKGFHIHFNPSLINACRRMKNEKIILGGSWNDINVVTICLLKRIGLLKSELLFWAEANYLTIGASQKNILRDKLRNFIYSCGDGKVVVPGKMSVETFMRWKAPFKKIIFLPNVIDESVFNGEKLVRQFDTLELPKFVIPARLTEKFKGILNFFEKIGADNVKKCIFYVLGDGPDENLYKTFIKEKGYEKHIFLEGFKNSLEVLEYYKNCNALILPSFSDQSPLALPEGLSCSLPLLVSNRCGNHFEAVQDGVNGYLLDPYNADSVKTVFEKFLNRQPEWEKMGENSLRLFNVRFKQEVVLKKFMESIES